VLLIDPGITSDEMDVLVEDLQQLGQPVVAGFSTHPHWDHLLWHAKFGDAPRYGTTRCVTEIRDFLSNADWQVKVAPMLPADIADKIPVDELFGRITELPEGTSQLPWEGPKVRILEHQGHAAGSAALLIEEYGVLVAGDMVSDILTPFFELDSADPVEDYLAALQLFESVADNVTICIPGHGSVGNAEDFRARIEQDRTYVTGLRDGSNSDDRRLTEGPQKDLLAGVHQWHQQQIAEKYRR
jgi:glyoxylase-like metal-dependent hydrolase (beta-lactamase superfamily II)